MWVERIQGNMVDGAGGAAGAEAPEGTVGRDPREVDFVDVPWDECGRTLKKRSRGGEEVRVLLPPGQRLRHGDVLFEDASRRVVVNVPPCEVIVARPAGQREAAVLALELGNLHWPAQVTEAEVLFVEDGPPMEVLRQLNVAWSRELRRFEPAPVSAGPGVKVSASFQVIRRAQGEPRAERAERAERAVAEPPPVARA